VLPLGFVGALTIRQLTDFMPDLLLTNNSNTDEDYDVTSDGRLVGHIFQTHRGARANTLDVGLRLFTTHRSISGTAQLCCYARGGHAGFRKRLVWVNPANRP
jgi:hypothetical protein